MRLLLVRHGIARSKRDWKGPDQDRPLTSSGERQARALPRRLVHYRPTRILTSPALRCRQTLEPLAATHGLPIEETKALASDAGPAALELIQQMLSVELPSSTVVACTHREVLDDVLPALATQYQLRLGHRPPGAKGGYWIALTRRHQIVSLDYRAPK